MSLRDPQVWRLRLGCDQEPTQTTPLVPSSRNGWGKKGSVIAGLDAVEWQRFRVPEFAAIAAALRHFSALQVAGGHLLQSAQRPGTPPRTRDEPLMSTLPGPSSVGYPPSCAMLPESAERSACKPLTATSGRSVSKLANRRQLTQGCRLIKEALGTLGGMGGT